MLTIGALAARSGAAASALRYYESLGLIAAERTGGNQRRYPQTTLRRVAFIQTAQRIGLSLEEIGAALETLPSGRTPTATDWARLSDSWRGRLDARIAQLQRLRDDLDSCIGCGCLSLRHCSLANPDDAAASRGVGAVILGEAPG